MVLGTDVEKILGRGAKDQSPTDGAQDISGGVTAELATDGGDSENATIFLETQGAVDVTIEFSPDNGDTWREPADESPVSFGSAGQDIVHVEYAATDVRLTGSNATGVDVDVRMVA